MLSSRNLHARLMLFTVTISSTLMPSGARPSKISCVSGKVTPSTSILAVRQIEFDQQPLRQFHGRAPIRRRIVPHRFHQSSLSVSDNSIEVAVPAKDAYLS